MWENGAAMCSFLSVAAMGMSLRCIMGNKQIWVFKASYHNVFGHKPKLLLKFYRVLEQLIHLLSNRNSEKQIILLSNYFSTAVAQCVVELN